MPINNPVAQLALSSILFGVGSVFVVFIQFDAVIIAFYRLLIGAGLFALILHLSHQPFGINHQALIFASLSGMMLGVDLALWNQSILIVGPGIATILNSLQIFFMAGFGVLMFADKPTRKLWLSLCLSFIGVILLCRHEWQTTANSGRGIFVGVASAVAFALSMLFMREAVKHQTNSLSNTMFYASITGAIALGIYALFSGCSFVTNHSASWLMMAIYGSVVHVLAWYLMAKAIPQLSVAVVGLLVSLEPIVVIMVDRLVLDKHLNSWQIFGAVLTIGAIYLGSQQRQASKTNNVT